MLVHWLKTMTFSGRDAPRLEAPPVCKCNGFTTNCFCVFGKARGLMCSEEGHNNFLEREAPQLVTLPICKYNREAIKFPVG